MIFLLLAIASSSLISVLMRIGSRKTDNQLGMLCMNYVACSALSALYTLPSGGPFPAGSALGGTLWLGAAAGILFLLAFILMQWNTVNNGIVLSSIFMKLGILVPVALSITVFHEQPSALQIIGFALAVAAILLINLGQGSTAAKSGLGLIVLLLAGGSADGMAKVYEQLGTPALENQYLLYTFAVAMVLCFAYTYMKGQRVRAADCLWGILLGIPNFFSAKFLLLSLSDVSAVIAYPTFSVGTIIVISLCGVILFHEKLSKRQLVGMGIILAALVLLNI